MIIKAINNNKIGAYLLMLLFVFMSWMSSLFSLRSYEPMVDNYIMPLWRIVQPLVAQSAFASSLLALLFAIVIALGLSRFSSRYGLLNRQSALPTFTYIVCLAAFPKVLSFSPVWIVALLFLVSTSLIYESHSMRRPAANMFLAALWISVGSLFYYKAVLLFPLLIILMFTVRVFNLKTLLATIIGILLPWYIYSGYYFYVDESWATFWSDAAFKSDTFFAFRALSLYDSLKLGFMCLLLVLSYLSVANYYNTKKIFVRLLYKAHIITTLYFIVLAFITGYTFDDVPIFMVPVSILFAHLIDNTKSMRWQDVFLLVLIIVAIVSQLLA